MITRIVASFKNIDEERLCHIPQWVSLFYTLNYKNLLTAWPVILHGAHK